MVDTSGERKERGVRQGHGIKRDKLLHIKSVSSTGKYNHYLNNFKGSIIYKNIEPLCCIPEIL